MPTGLSHHYPIPTDETGPLETNAMQALRQVSEHLNRAAVCLEGTDYQKLFNDIKGLEGVVDAERNALLTPPAP